MFQSLKLRIYLLTFLPFLCIIMLSIYTQVSTFHRVTNEVSKLTESAIISIEKKRLVTVLDSAISIIQDQVNKPGKEGLDDAMTLLNNYKFDNGAGYLYAYDMQGTRIMHGAGASLGTNLIELQDKKGNFILKDLIKAATQGDGFSTFFFPKPGGKEALEKYGYAVHIKKWDIVIGSGFYIDGVDEVNANMSVSLEAIEESSFISTSIILAVFTSVLTLIVLISSKTIFKSLLFLRNSVESLAAGKGDLTQKIPESNVDILNDIANYFNVFIESMAVDIKELKKSSEALYVISKVSNEQKEKLEKVSIKQIDETNMVATAIEEMASNSIEIAESAKSTRHSAEKTEIEIQEVVKQVQLSSGQLDELSRVLGSVEQSVAVVGENVEGIDIALGVIQGISEQTNLLALNAAIEAARAGEQGRGFAVVADEVRGLAQRSQQSTVQIKEILEKLQSSAEKMIDDMKGSTIQREKVTDAMSKINDIIESSTASIKNLTLMNVQVATAANEQSQVANSISKNVSGVAALAENIGSDSIETSHQMKKLEEQSRIIKNITDKFNV